MAHISLLSGADSIGHRG